ncbi:hypothetical protein LEMA_P051890.1 [Plenodomus lingam JN3]|uniref:Transcription factor domain-containing protein n=1 Tax=Leptosphaeria maculans (strain JN3 / isolate v23.1.3 / race Av1-4-5-6-7-8) TaxID=985895 RepID=E4ZMD4_LEPMJ|nr:hypothetical protein LEMA_P051890.1 [Plenodomus lingam JN3]CBX92483.1 hypothetical protein LEMA_P051890.1 [Plenodomus lingam JN3]
MKVILLGLWNSTVCNCYKNAHIRLITRLGFLAMSFNMIEKLMWLSVTSFLRSPCTEYEMHVKSYNTFQRREGICLVSRLFHDASIEAHSPVSCSSLASLRPSEMRDGTSGNQTPTTTIPTDNEYIPVNNAHLHLPALSRAWSTSHALPFISISNNIEHELLEFDGPTDQLWRQHRERGPRNTKSKSSTEKNCAPIKDGDYTFITAAKPADFRSKKTMTAVRKTAMASFLKNEKSKEISSRDSTDESNGVASDGSFSQVATQTAVNTSDTSDSLHPPKCSNRKQQPVSTRQPPHIHLDTPSSPQNQVARLHTPIASLSKPAELITPSRQGIELPFDIKVVPELRSLGKALDPFGTMFQSSNSLVSVEKLKWHCSRYFGTYGLGKHWIPYCLDHPHTFLSTLCLAAAHKDVLEERSSESLETAALRQDVIIMVGENLLNPSQSVADHNIIAVLQLIICEVISRKEADLAFHETGMEAMIEKRGGLYQLGVNGRLASAVSWVHLTSAILRGAEARPMYLEFCNTHQMSNYPASVTIPDSPIFCPRERLFTLERSSKCSPKALELLNDMRAMVDLFLSEESQPAPSKANGLARLHAKITVDYPPVAHFARTRVLREEDWKYEAIRITAVVLSTAMLLRVPLPQSLAAAAPTRNLSTTSTTSMASRSNELLHQPFL